MPQMDRSIVHIAMSGYGEGVEMFAAKSVTFHGAGRDTTYVSGAKMHRTFHIMAGSGNWGVQIGPLQIGAFLVLRMVVFNFENGCCPTCVHV